MAASEAIFSFVSRLILHIYFLCVTAITYTDSTRIQTLLGYEVIQSIENLFEFQFENQTNKMRREKKLETCIAQNLCEILKS